MTLWTNLTSGQKFRFCWGWWWDGAWGWQKKGGRSFTGQQYLFKVGMSSLFAQWRVNNELFIWTFILKQLLAVTWFSFYMCWLIRRGLEGERKNVCSSLRMWVPCGGVSVIGHQPRYNLATNSSPSVWPLSTMLCIISLHCCLSGY